MQSHISSQELYCTSIHSDARSYNTSNPIKGMLCGVTKIHVEPALEGECKIPEL